MKGVTQYIERPDSVLTGRPVKHLYTLPSFPVYMGCVETPVADDIVADMLWGIDENGMIQLTKLLPLDTLYLAQHNDGVGMIWQEHYRAFTRFLLAHARPGEILEIGGAHDIIAAQYLQERPDDHWIIVEPNPGEIHHPRITLIRGWFDESFKPAVVPNTIVHSHVFEHMYQPFDFLRQIRAILPDDGRCTFSFPNMVPMLKRKFTNCLNFEHTAFLAEPFVDAMLQRIGFEVVAKEYFGAPHSIFYAVQKSEPNESVEVPNHFEEYKSLFDAFISFHKNEVKTLNVRIEEHEGPVYLFGAHIFSQYLIQFGLRADNIVSILDNSTQKQGKRLYATSLKVESPEVLAGLADPAVIVRASVYNDEIKKDILENINPNVTFW